MSREKIAVLNACNPIHVERESDVYVDYQDGNFFDGDTMIKKCVSWHSIPAAFETEFHVYKKEGWQGIFKWDHILVMVKDDPKELFPLISKLKLMKKTVGIAFHENGNYFSLKANDLAWLHELKSLVEMGDYFWNLNVPLEEFFSQVFDVPIFSCWHAFPHDWNHGFTVPIENREGIFIGTRTLSQNLKRNTLFSLGVANKIAAENKTFATFFCEDKIDLKFMQSYLINLGLENTRIIPGPLPYESWLKLIATHKVLFQMDASDTLGQVVGDAVLVGVPSVGGTTVNSHLFGTYCEVGDHAPALSAILENPDTPNQFEESFAAFRKATSLPTLKEIHKKQLFPQIGIK